MTRARDEGADVLLVEKNTAGRSGSSIMGSGQLNVYNPRCGMETGKRDLPAVWLEEDPKENRFNKKWLAWEVE